MIIRNLLRAYVFAAGNLMSNKKDIHVRKYDILDHINDLKVNFNAMALINKALIREKREGFKLNFQEKDIKEKKADILNIIRREGGSALKESVIPANFEGDYSFDDINNINGINNILKRFLLNKNTGILKVINNGELGKVGFANGEIVYVLFKGVEGAKGFFYLQNVTEGKTKFYIQNSIEGVRNIDKDTSVLIRRTLLGS